MTCVSHPMKFWAWTTGFYLFLSNSFIGFKHVVFQSTCAIFDLHIMINRKINAYQRLRVKPFETRRGRLVPQCRGTDEKSGSWVYVGPLKLRFVLFLWFSQQL